MSPSITKTSPFMSKEVEEGNDYKMEALQRAAKERADIVNKYAMGEDSEGEEDHWEDSAFKVYKITDRYGFLHEEELSEIPSLEEERRKSIEIKRRDKWIKMVKKWQNYEGTEKLRSRVSKGIPLSIRGDAWKLMLNVAGVMRKDPTVYEEMRKRAEAHSPDIKQIDMDVNRTYRNHIMFRRRYSIKQQQLFHVLAAYSMYNTEVGYCQGMSQIAALLLMYMSEEEAFWALHSLLYGKKHLMHGFFIPGFPKLIRFQDHHDKILKKFTPRLKKHLDKNEIFASLYTMKWFFQCFLDRSPFPLTLRLWDLYVLEGEKILVAMSYTTLKMHKSIMKKMEMEEIVTLLQERLACDFGSDDDNVVDQLKQNLTELRKAKMDLPPAAGDDETAKLPFGVPVKPTFAQETGLRSPYITPKLNNNTRVEDNNLKNKLTAPDSEQKDLAINGSIPVTSDEMQSDEKTTSSPSNGRATSDSHHDKRSSRHVNEDSELNSSGKRTQRDSKSSFKQEKVRKERKKSNKEKRRSDLRSQSSEEKRLSAGISDNQQSADRRSKHEQTNPDQTNSKNNMYTSSDEPSQKPSATRSNQAPLPSSNDYSTDSTHPRRDKDENNRGKVKIVWKNPSKSVSTNQSLHPHSSDTFSSSPATPQDSTWSDEPSNRPSAKYRNESHGYSASSNERITSYKKSHSEDVIQSKARIKSNQIEVANPSVNDKSTHSHNLSSVPPRSGRSDKGRKFVFDPAKLYSTYDNINDSAFTESEDDVIADLNLSVAVGSPTSDNDNESVYEAKMEESLESLRELAAGLSRTPSPHVYSTHRRSPRKQLSPLAGNKASDSGQRKRHSGRPKSLEVIDIAESDIDQIGLNPLDQVARSLTRSAEVLEQRKQKKQSSSAFRKAVEGAGITQLPKRPSSTSVNTLLAPNRPANHVKNYSYSWQVPEHSDLHSPPYHSSPPTDAPLHAQNQGYGMAKEKHHPVRWLDTALDQSVSLTYNYPGQERGAAVETQPTNFNFVRREQNVNSNNRNGSRMQQPIRSPLAVDQSRTPTGNVLRSSRYPFGQVLSSEVPQDTLTHARNNSITYYSRHGVSDIKKADEKSSPHYQMKVTRYDQSGKKQRGMTSSKSHPVPGGDKPSWQQHSPADHFIDITQCSPDHSPNLAGYPIHDPIRSVTVGHSHTSNSARNLHHVNDRRRLHHSGASESPSRFRHYVVPESDVEGESLTLSNSSWSHTRRKNSSSIAIQTEQSDYHPDGSLV